MSGQAIRRLAILRLADDILRRNDVSAPPVSTDLVHAEAPHIRIVPGALKQAASSLKLVRSADGEHEEAIITFNENAGIPRQRFSIAHEFGHYLLHHRTLLDALAPTPSDAKAREAEADLFASALLVPLGMLDAFAPDFGYDTAGQARLEKLAFKLASQFNVSKSCMNKALFQLYHLRKVLGET